jgi:hypothetical protein
LPRLAIELSYENTRTTNDAASGGIAGDSFWRMIARSGCWKPLTHCVNWRIGPTVDAESKEKSVAQRMH